MPKLSHYNMQVLRNRKSPRPCRSQAFRITDAQTYTYTALHSGVYFMEPRRETPRFAYGWVSGRLHTGWRIYWLLVNRRMCGWGADLDGFAKIKVSDDDYDDNDVRNLSRMPVVGCAVNGIEHWWVNVLKMFYLFCRSLEFSLLCYCAWNGVM
jgi:hypothetical protein